MLAETTQKTKQLREMSRLENIADLADCTALLECEDIDKRVGKFMRDTNAIIAAHGLGDYIRIVHSRPKHFSVFTPTLTYNTIKILQSVFVPYDFEGLASRVFYAHKRFTGIVDGLISEARHRQLEDYAPLLALTVKERPFVQDYLVAETALYFISPGLSRVHRAEVNIERGTCSAFRRVLLDDSTKDQTLGRMMWEDVLAGRNVYQVYNPSRKISPKALMRYMLKNLKNDFMDNTNPKEVPEHVYNSIAVGPKVNDAYVECSIDFASVQRKMFNSILERYASGTLFETKKGKGEPN